MTNAPSITLTVEHRDDVPALVLAKEYVAAVRAAGCGEVVTYTISGMRGIDVKGTLNDLFAAIEKAAKDDDGFFSFTTEAETEVQGVRGQGGHEAWLAIMSHGPCEAPPTSTWMQSMVRVARSAIGLPRFVDLAMRRHLSGRHDFLPRPPLTRGANHLVTTTEQEVVERYEDPEVFWRIWDAVERFGDQRLCIRGLDAIDDVPWLARVFQDEMQLARTARPGLTNYYDVSTWFRELASFWERGDIRDNKAGFPALEYAGYDVATRTIEFAGYCSKTPLGLGGEDPRDVLIREIHEVRALAKAGKDGQGRPVDAVRVVFAEEWMAREQRRPLLDVGAKVFFTDRKSGALVAISD